MSQLDDAFGAPASTSNQKYFRDQDNLMEMDSLDLDNDELSACWINRQHTLDSEDLNLNLSDCGSFSFDEDIFEDCKQAEGEPVSVRHKQHSTRRASRSPPRQRIRVHSPERIRDRSFLVSPVVSEVRKGNSCSSMTRDDLYNAALNNLASSMRRSELSRAQVLRHSDRYSRVPESSRHDKFNLPQQNGQQRSFHGPSVSSNAAPSTLTRLTDLLSGKRTALTAGLEQSRNQLRMYMSLLNSNQPF